MAKNSRLFSRRELFGLLAFFPSANYKQTLIKPQYQIGQWVREDHVIDDPLNLRDGQLTYSIGCIIGLVYEHPDWLLEELKRGWTYYVRWHTDYEFACDPYTDFSHETDLKPFHGLPWIKHRLLRPGASEAFF